MRKFQIARTTQSLPTDNECNKLSKGDATVKNWVIWSTLCLPIRIIYVGYKGKKYLETKIQSFSVFFRSMVILLEGQLYLAVKAKTFCFQTCDIFLLIAVKERVARRKIRLIESNAKCRYLKIELVKGLCGRCFICLRPTPNPLTLLSPPLTHCIRVYSILFHTEKGGGGRANQREG